jgi:hypothetical protein
MPSRTFSNNINDSDKFVITFSLSQGGHSLCEYSSPRMIDRICIDTLFLVHFHGHRHQPEFQNLQTPAFPLPSHAHCDRAGICIFAHAGFSLVLHAIYVYSLDSLGIRVDMILIDEHYLMI